MPQNIFATGEAWKTYKRVEKEFLDFIEYVPLTKDHSNVYSIKLSDILIRLGSYIDTFFKEMLLFDGLDKSSEINPSKLKEYRKRKEKGLQINIVNYREIFEPFYELNRRPILVYEYDCSIRPFFSFKKGESPKWWYIYNEVKHDLYTNMKKATLDQVEEALAGLFLLNAIHMEGRTYLLKIGVIRSDSIPHHKLEDYLQTDVDIEGRVERHVVAAQSGLFMYSYAGPTWDYL